MTSPIPIIVLDTNVVSESARLVPDPHILAWIDRQVRESMFVTTVTEAELRYGVARMPAGRRRDQLSQIYERMFSQYFAGRILPFDRAAAVAYAEIRAHRQSIGRPIPPFDCAIAAIARSYGAAVATRNVRDFADCGVPLINPWEMGGSV